MWQEGARHLQIACEIFASLERTSGRSGGGREIVEIVEIIGIVGIVLSSPKMATNRPCSWHLVNCREGREKKKNIRVHSIGKHIEILRIT